jgi:hypothetical protein
MIAILKERTIKKPQEGRRGVVIVYENLIIDELRVLYSPF